MTLTKQAMRMDIYDAGVSRASHDEVIPVIEDEFSLLGQWLPMRGASILDLGCGKAVMSRRMLAEGKAARVVGMDTDKIQMTALQGQALPEGLTLVEGGAQLIVRPCWAHKEKRPAGLLAFSMVVVEHGTEPASVYDVL